MKPPFSRPYTLLRAYRGPQVVVDFTVVEQGFSPELIWATIQPLDARTLLSLPEGLRSRARYACFTYAICHTARAGEGESDRVEVQGEVFEVHGGYEDGPFGAPIPGNEYVLAAPEIAP